MMKSPTSFLLTTMIMISSVTFVAGQGDPVCRNGLAGAFGLAGGCCPLMCGACGGPGCDTRPGGPNNCCGQVIQAAGLSCDTNMAPCTIARDPDCVTGIANRAEGICCAAACGTCGGVAGQGCQQRFNVPMGQPTADRCCTADVQNSNRPCDNFPPPCTLAAVVIPPPVVIQPPVVIPPPAGCVAQNTKMQQCLDRGYMCDQCRTRFGTRRVRRSLGEVNARHLVESLSHPECAATDYEMYLVVDGAHFAGLATPTSHITNKNNCPSMVFHAQAYTSNGNRLEKIALHVDEEEVAELEEGNKLLLGTKPLAAIVDAFESAPVSKEGLLYDAISNNCIVMLRNMADPLDIPVDHRMLTFITSKLTGSASEHIIEMMKASPTLNTLYEGSRRLKKGVSTEDLISKVIQLYV